MEWRVRSKGFSRDGDTRHTLREGQDREETQSIPKPYITKIPSISKARPSRIIPTNRDHNVNQYGSFLFLYFIRPQTSDAHHVVNQAMASPRLEKNWYFVGSVLTLLYPSGCRSAIFV